LFFRHFSLFLFAKMSLEKESSGLAEEPPRGSGWEPEDFLAPYAAETFEVEKHATKILQAGNINEEVGLLLILYAIFKSHLTRKMPMRKLFKGSVR